VQIEQMVDFTTDAKVYKQLWTIRKGTFPAVGAVRETGTTVIIEVRCGAVRRYSRPLAWR
jgi:D-lactate dehydrogenase